MAEPVVKLAVIQKFGVIVTIPACFAMVLYQLIPVLRYQEIGRIHNVMNVRLTQTPMIIMTGNLVFFVLEL